MVCRIKITLFQYDIILTVDQHVKHWSNIFKRPAINWLTVCVVVISIFFLTRLNCSFSDCLNHSHNSREHVNESLHTQLYWKHYFNLSRCPREKWARTMLRALQVLTFYDSTEPWRRVDMRRALTWYSSCLRVSYSCLPKLYYQITDLIIPHFNWLRNTMTWLGPCATLPVSVASLCKHRTVN